MRQAKPVWLLLGLTPCFCAFVHAAEWPDTEARTQANCVVEWTYTSQKTYRDPFQDATIDAVIESPTGGRQRLPGFWAGGDRWRFRFSSSKEGTYCFRTACSDTSNRRLHGRRGRVVVEPYTGQNELYRRGAIHINPKGKFFEHADGTPFFWLADSWWLGMCKRFHWPDGFKTLTRDRKDKGFTVIQFPAGFACDMRPFDPRGANAAGFPLTEGYETINPAYFDLVDARIEWLVEQELMPSIMASWGYYLPFMGVDKMKSYWRYVIARYGAYPVVWNLAGESTLIYYLTPPSQRGKTRRAQIEGWSEVARYIERIDPYGRLLTVHPGPSSGRFRPIADMSPIDFVMVQPGHGGWETIPSAIAHLQRAAERYPTRPVLHGEVCFEGMHGGGSGPKIQRTLFWSSVLGGAPGYSYGADGIWQFNTTDAPFGPSPGGYVWGNTPWQEARHWLGSQHVGIGRKILERFAWHRFEPHPEWIEPAADAEDFMHGYAAGVPRQIRMIYYPRKLPWGPRSFVKHLEENVTYEATFIDPMTGQSHAIGDVEAVDGRWEVPMGPILQDWLLVLTATE
jgi:hypothetical protein